MIAPTCLDAAELRGRQLPPGALIAGRSDWPDSVTGYVAACTVRSGTRWIRARRAAYLYVTDDRTTSDAINTHIRAGAKNKPRSWQAIVMLVSRFK